jgi:predicted DCC family thiol-disulfide oxidoreductase YuxK
MVAVDPFPGKGLVLFDGDCPFCRKTVSLLQKFDWLKALRFQNCREPDKIPTNYAGLTEERMIEEMHLLRPDRQKAYPGYKAVRWIAGRVPAMWPLWPLLFVPGVPYIGDIVYKWVARNRFKIVPCENGVCSIPPKRQ